MSMMALPMFVVILFPISKCLYYLLNTKLLLYLVTPWLYNPRWVLADCTILLLCCRSSINAGSYCIPMVLRSAFMLSRHLILGRPKGLRRSGAHSQANLTILESGCLCTCPAHCSLLAFISCTISGSLYNSDISWLVLIRCCCVTGSRSGPKILRRTFLSKTQIATLADN
ncbi:unnamed protein product [Callosobruchus maculatus]|uniref:Uncharacterized protein n=1 Tax=Callosobruchus maculatus TaxID=64391 RepID=A0A653CVJ3_CALMS|nr:unnamed protein product [Callosobruchus maculatus]